MPKRLLLVFLFTLSLFCSVSAQTRFKFSSWNAIQLAGDDDYDRGLYYVAFGGLLDKRFKINQELRIGMFYKSVEYSFHKEDYNFQDFLLQQHPDMTPAKYDSISGCRVAFGYLSIPIGYNYYLGPRSYLSYNLNINFSMNNARYGAADSSDTDIITGKLDNNMVHSVFIDHELSYTIIILRRIEFFLGVSWNINSSLLKESSKYQFVQEFGKSSAKYTMMKVGINIYTFQFKRKKL